MRSSPGTAWLTDPRGGIGRTLDENERLRPDKTAVVWREVRLSYGELAAAVRAQARALRASGVGEGDRVAVVMKNRPELIVTVFACARLGAIPVVANWRLAPAELAVVLEDADCTVIIADPAVVPPDGYVTRLRVKPLLVTVEPATGSVRVDGSVAYEAWIAAADSLDDVAAAPDPSTCVILYTSGTTGRPKGVMIGHFGIWALLSKAWEDWQVDTDSVLLCPLPTFHIGGFGWFLVAIACGATVVLHDEADPVAILEAVEREKLTSLLLVPTLLNAVVEEQRRRSVSIASLKTIVYGASPIGSAQLRAAIDVLEADLIQAYGLTEMTSSVTQLGPEDHRRAAHQSTPIDGVDLLRTCGRPRRGVDISIHSLEDGGALPAGRVGEVWIRADQRMQGYWRRPEETGEALLADGTLRTGDLGYFDASGYLYLVDRLKDMIVSGGENVYPIEVENVLLDHPAVADVAVIGIPHPKWVETPKAFVMVKPGAAEPTASDLIDFCRERIARYKAPTEVEFVEALPRNASGKLLKRELR